MSGASGLYKKLRRVYSSWYLLLNLVILLVYYLVVQKLLAIQQFGIAFVAAPAYLVILLVVSSSVLMTIAVYTIASSRKKTVGIEEAASSGVTAVLGGIMSGCGCQGAILYSALAAVAGGGEAFAINTVFAEHIALILGALVIFNIALVVYSLGRLPGGRAR